jgi:hypothetical protein
MLDARRTSILTASPSQAGTSSWQIPALMCKISTIYGVEGLPVRWSPEKISFE